VLGGDLYVGGCFSTAGGTSATNLAKWNGSAWSALGSGPDGPVSALAVSGSDLYAGGWFTTAGGASATGVAKWNPTTGWSAVGTDLYGVLALAVSGSDLYAGGNFTAADGITANRIAKWDGSAWSALGSGLNNVVNALAVSGSGLYVGGQFTTAGGKVSAYLAKASLASSPPAFISIVPNLSGTQVLLTFTGDPGASFHLLSSTNLKTWQTNSTVNALDMTNSVSVSITQPQEFFRLRRLP